MEETEKMTSNLSQNDEDSNTDHFSSQENSVPDYNKIMEYFNPPKVLKEFEELTEYVEPSNVFDMNKDNEMNKQLFHRLSPKRSGLLSLRRNPRQCDSCKTDCKRCFHCFKCQDFDLCEKCYESRTGYHEHDGGINYFHKLNECPAEIRTRLVKKRNSVLEMLACFEVFSDRYFFGTRNSLKEHVKWVRYCEIQEKMENVIRGGLANKMFERGEYFGLLSKLNLEWVVSDFVCLFCGMIPVPIHQSLGYEDKKYIFNLTKVKYLLVTPEYLDEAVKLSQDCESLKYLILVDSSRKVIPHELHERRRIGKGVSILRFSDLEAIGKEKIEEIKLRPNIDLKQDDTMTVILTSGTTGQPKCVLFLEKNFRSIVSNTGWSVFPTVECLLYTTQVIGRLVLRGTFSSGGRVFLLTNDPSNMFEDYGYYCPTRLTSPPKVLNMLYDKFKEEVERKMGESLRIIIEEGGDRKMEISMIRKKVMDETFLEFRRKKKELFGDSLMSITVGGGPTSPKVKRFTRMVTDLPVHDGYGTTEVGGLWWNGYKTAEIRLMDCPSLGYLGTDLPYPRGEIVVRDAGQLNRYFTDVISGLSTNSGVDEDGFYHTGDIAENVDGFFNIIDRKSNIVKVGNKNWGTEFFSLSEIENKIKQKVDIVEEIVLFPNPFRTKIFALVKITDGCVMKKSQDFGSKKVRVLISELATKGPNALEMWQIPSKIALIEEKFTVENKMLTISYKKNRRRILDFFNDLVQKELFEEE